MDKFKIGTRLTLGFTSLVLLIVLLAGVSLWRMQSAERADAHLANHQELARLITAWDKNIAVNTTRAVALANIGDPDVRQQFERRMADTMKSGAELHSEIEQRLTDPAAVALYEKTQQARTSYVDGRADAIRALDAGDTAAAQNFFRNQMQGLVDTYTASIGNLLAYQHDLIRTTTQQASEHNQRALILLMVLTALAILIGITLAITITRSIIRPLGRAVRTAQTVAGRDLTADIRASGNDETALLLRALQQMTDSLRTVVGDVRHGAREIATASNQILAGNQDLASRTEEQASSLTETAAAMEQLTATVRQNADNAQQANTLAMTASQVATRGGEIVAQVTTTMNSINDSSKKVEDIIGVIDSIAFQTNILALNAAVESARAGEAGRGFAVVAGEVRSLAQRSAQAAREIKELITASVQAASDGSRLVNETGTTMNEIVQAVQRVTDIMGEITAASQEQSAGIGQVNEAVLQMDQTTRQNAALVEQAAAAAASLQEQASTLARLVETFKITDRPGAVAAAAPAKVRPGTETQSIASPSRPQQQAPSKHTSAAPAISHARPAKSARTSAAAQLAAPQPAFATPTSGLDKRKQDDAAAMAAHAASSATGRRSATIGAFQTSAGPVEEWEEF